MEEKATRELKESVQVIYKDKKTTPAPTEKN
ncbi:hypothetical protein P378_15925 [Desulforamulus profundi]|uniref:Uncharacterized protein n=1 Tax=Desulforamulus profundi TaxID=1383067 RepID=A0A2C6MD36_9FIRM|nr:hypothetical protein P378_15925 [Desulforamulus profundi]